jgi:hypothetical protein
MERKLRIGEPDAANMPFIFGIGDSVRLKFDHSMAGTIKDGCFQGKYPSGPYAIRYEIEIQDSQMFSADQMELEKITKD